MEHEKLILKSAQKGDIEKIRDLILKLSPEECSTLVNVQDEDGYTPLHRASYNGHVPVIELLLKWCVNCFEILSKVVQT